jgi:hypothetical protein
MLRAIVQKPYALSLALVITLLIGCSAQDVPGIANGAPEFGYSGALDTSYEGALDVSTQLALGTFKLEGTADAVTREQAGALLPLWQALQGSTLRGASERSAVLRQIESTMSEAQVLAIAGMRLTADDVREWAQAQPGGPVPGGQVQGGGGQGPGRGQGSGGGQGGAAAQMSDEERATRRAQLQNMSEEERATRIAQFRQGAAGGGARSAQQGTGVGSPLSAVVALLSERAGVAPPPAAARQRPTRTPMAAERPKSAPTETPIAAPTATQAIGPTQAATVASPAMPTPVETERAPSATPTVASSVVQPPTAAPASYDSPGLVQLPDNDPGPPLTVEVSANRAYPDPLVEQSRTYQVSGIVRNDGSAHYALSALHVTFFDAEGFRGSYRRFPGPGRMGGEWLWHGRTEANVPCLLLAPGEECPFDVEITAQDMASFLIHSDASATERQSVPLEADGLRLSRDSTGYVQIAGQVRNDQPFRIKNVVLSGVLLDDKGEMVSLGSTYLLQEDIGPGQIVEFDIRVEDPMNRLGVPFTDYRVYAQAERDWD